MAFNNAYTRRRSWQQPNPTPAGAGLSAAAASLDQASLSAVSAAPAISPLQAVTLERAPGVYDWVAVWGHAPWKYQHVNPTLPPSTLLLSYPVPAGQVLTLRSFAHHFDGFSNNGGTGWMLDLLNLGTGSQGAPWYVQLNILVGGGIVPWLGGNFFTASSPFFLDPLDDELEELAIKIAGPNTLGFLLTQQATTFGTSAARAKGTIAPAGAMP